MKKIIILCFLLPSIFCKAQQNQINIKFFDEKTGFAVLPNYYKLVNEKAGVVFENNFRTTINLLEFTKIPKGKYQLSVAAFGYKSMTTSFELNNIEPLNINFQFEKENPLFETTFEFIHAQQSAENILVTGFVSNDADGLPLSNVQVYNLKNNIFTKTDANGFFKIKIPLSLNVNDLALHFTCKGYNEEVRKNYDAYSYGDVGLKIALKKGNTINEENVVVGREPALMMYDRNIKYDRNYLQPKIYSNRLTQIPDCATTIKVGKTCSCHTCTNGFDVLNFNTYAANVVTSEWGQWGAWTNGIQSLNAGAVAIRSYALNRIAFPIASHGSYDICNTTCCHVYNPSTTATTYAIASISNTDNYILLTSTNNVAQAEFAAETNDNCSPIQTSGNYCGQCGDGKFQKSVNGPPINSGGCYPATGIDPVCVGQTNSGHPRGMCQRGSVRWATGFMVPNNTTIGTAHAFGTKTWQQMMAYYYPYYTLSQCNIIASPTLPGAFTLAVTPECNGTTTQNKLQWTASSNASTYTVYRNSVLLSSGITGTQFLNTSIVPGVNYNYYVSANNTSGSTNNSNGIVNATANICDAISVDSSSIFISPNPTSGLFYVNIKNNTSKVFSISVFSSIGKQLLTLSSKTTSNNYKQQINIAQHASGLYFIKIEIEGTSVTKNILKQ
jgi:Secretion system C-terminal sorting domain/Stage II sporulation protein